MILDQATSPFTLNAAFLYYLGMFDGKSHAECINDIKKVNFLNFFLMIIQHNQETNFKIIFRN